MFEWAKTVHALDRPPTVIGLRGICCLNIQRLGFNEDNNSGA
jgi:hypothetical protein